MSTRDPKMSKSPKQPDQIKPLTAISATLLATILNPKGTHQAGLSGFLTMRGTFVPCLRGSSRI